MEVRLRKEINISTWTSVISYLITGAIITVITEGIIYALKNQILTWKLVANERFPLLPPDYGIFLNLSRKRFFLKRYMTFSFIIFVFSFSFIFKMCML